MAQSINLIPQQEVKAQQKVKVVKMSSVITVLLLLIVSGVTAYYWYKTNTIKEQISSEETKIESYRRDISNLAEIEITARTLDAKYQILDDFFNTRRNYSQLLVELRKRVPATVGIESLSLSGDTKNILNLSGASSDYNSIARFTQTLGNKQFEGAEPGLEGLFGEVTLNSVTLDPQNQRVNYFIVASFMVDLLN